jgi:hypothetical protein
MVLAATSVARLATLSATASCDVLHATSRSASAKIAERRIRFVFMFSVLWPANMEPHQQAFDFCGEPGHYENSA